MNKRSWPAALDSVSQIREYIGEEIAGLGVDDRLAFQLGLAIEELTVNIVKYAYKDNLGQTIDVAIQKGPYQVTIHVMDRGVPFNPMKAPEPDIEAPLEDRQVGGLGLFLVKNLVDEIKYERIGDQNHLMIMKSIKQEAGHGG